MPFNIAAWIIAALALFGTLYLHLLPALLAGLLVYELIIRLASHLPERWLHRQRAKLLAMSLLAALVVAAVAAAIAGAAAFFHSDSGSLSALMTKMADILEGARAKLPEALATILPADVEGLRSMWTDWLREHAADVKTVGKEAGRGLAHILIGLVVGGMLAFRQVGADALSGPLAIALRQRAERVAEAFRRVVFAQVKISAVNSVLTGIYILGVLPLFGVHLPFAKTLVAVAFLTGLVPVLGNLVSNVVIVVVSLSHSLDVALASLIFLVVIHKLEYFLNARIVGAGIGARAWELLIAMLMMEAAFGIPGVVAAPIFYAYLKDELKNAGAI